MWVEHSSPTTNANRRAASNRHPGWPTSRGSEYRAGGLDCSTRSCSCYECGHCAWLDAPRGTAIALRIREGSPRLQTGLHGAGFDEQHFPARQTCPVGTAKSRAGQRSRHASGTGPGGTVAVIAPRPERPCAAAARRQTPRRYTYAAEAFSSAAYAWTSSRAHRPRWVEPGDGGIASPTASAAIPWRW